MNQDILNVKVDDISKILEWAPRSNSQIFDKNGKIISEQFNHYQIYSKYQSVPAGMIEAITSIEDKKFFQHNGIDILAILRATLKLFHHAKIKQGASTITQQVVRRILLTNDKTINRKFKEIILSLYLENYISKEKIMEIYINTMYLGNGSYGIAAASKRYFNKDLEQLDTHEMALIAGLFQLPSFTNPNRHQKRAKARQLKVLEAMYKANKISLKQFKYYSFKKLKYQFYQSQYGKNAPFFTDYAIKEANKILQKLKIDIKNTGIKIYTTLDPKLQALAEDTFINSKDIFNRAKRSIINQHTDRIQGLETIAVEASLMAVNTKSGEIVTLIGGRDYSRSQFNRATEALRQPGSLFKSIIYSLALKKGKKWNDVFYISPITIGNYRPRTQSSELLSVTTMMNAFYKSINSTAVTIGHQLGIKEVIKFAQKMGIKSPLKEETATYLGSSDVTMLDMARVYSVYANNGATTNLSVINKIEDKDGQILYLRPTQKENKQILGPNTNQLMLEGLKQVVKRGTGHKIRNLSNFTAGKTGTSNGSKDNWFCGLTNDLVVIVWVGNDYQSSFKGNISAANTATPLWGRFVKKSITYLKTKKLSNPKNLFMKKIHSKFGVSSDEIGVPMYFRNKNIQIKEKSDLVLLEEGKQLRIGI